MYHVDSVELTEIWIQLEIHTLLGGTSPYGYIWEPTPPHRRQLWGNIAVEIGYS